jgi:hypothetical protein
MMTTPLSRLLPAALAVVLVACGGSKPPAESAPGTATDATPAEASGTPWAELNKEQRASFMMQVVQPKMKGLFQQFDAGHFSKFGCGTCHGEGAKNKSFAMPNAMLPKLPSTMEAFEKVKAEKPEMVKFMAEVVVPEMAKLLNEEPFDPATGKGFGCGECHTHE